MIRKFIQSFFEELDKPNYPDSNAIARAESMPHTKFEKVLEDFSAQHAGTVIGYYLPEENTVELQCDGEYGFDVFGDEPIPCVKPAFSSEEAKKIFDFFYCNLLQI